MLKIEEKTYQPNIHSESDKHNQAPVQTFYISQFFFKYRLMVIEINKVLWSVLWQCCYITLVLHLLLKKQFKNLEAHVFSIQVLYVEIWQNGI